MTSADIHDPLFGQHLTFTTTARDSGGDLLAADVRLDPDGRVPRHVHLRQDERVEVVEGSVSMTIAGKTRVLGPGDTADVPRRAFHVVSNASDAPARFRLEVRPARRTERGMRVIFGVSRALARILRRGRS